MLSDLISDLLSARLQMAFTLAFHIVLACLGVGMPVLMLVAEAQFIRTSDAIWKQLALRWSRAFAVLFAVGAVSGTVLSFELGMLWPEFMGRFGAVIGLPFTLEGFAFFVEAIFVGIYLYGWDRLPKIAHWISGIPIVLSGAASAWFVVTANAWMNAPTGFEMVDDQVTAVDPIAAMLNPATGAQTTHMIVAAYMVTGFLVASYYAVGVFRGNHSTYQLRALWVALTLGVVCAPLQLPIGHWAAHTVAKTQKVKLAAMEGQFQTERGAPLRIGGWPDEEARTTRWAIEIDGLLSWIAYGDFDAEVQGLDDVPLEDQPPVAIVHIAFQIMVGIGLGLVGLSVWTLIRLLRRRSIKQSKLFLLAIALSGPLTVLAMQAGWVVTEVGRQPWVVQGYMRTSEAVTDAPGIQWLLVATLAVYTLLGVVTIVVLRMLARIPIEEK